ncbi:hypothetical protein CRU92_04040 [Arcobacter sp. FW59]|nr:hypothetical protein CRU92_04040 [Arcobacter sp. FW59]
MIKKLSEIFIYIIFSIFIFMFLLPKELIYNLVEKELEKHKIVVSDESINEKFSLDILDANIFYEGINIAKVNRANFLSFLIYSKFDIENIKLEDKFKNFIPDEIEKISFQYNILTFNKIYVKANGKFGELEAEISIFDKVVNIELNASNDMKKLALIRYFKYENERYKYEYKF